MLTGDPLEFAVEIFHEPESPRWKGFGRMCVHIEGVVLGRLHERHCSLFHAVERITEVADQLPSLWDSRFASRSDDSIFSMLDAAFYQGTEPNCWVPDEYLLESKRPLLVGREVLAAVVAGWKDRVTTC